MTLTKSKGRAPRKRVMTDEEIRDLRAALDDGGDNLASCNTGLCAGTSAYRPAPERALPWFVA
jgi:hypothetical protein